ncbi:MAG: DNA topoisomerase IB [Gemmatimonadota bacterium]|nr:DNA topoisomerase IB [Gemmatimonadota bacterium]
MALEELRELEDPEIAAREAGLSYVSDEAPGLSRHRRGKGWSYHRPDGELITDPAEKERLDALAIPPAWSDVWICPHPDGHLQATGRDDRGRKQYRYHPDWRAVRDVAKYARMIPFGRSLPKIRRTVAGNLRRKGLPRVKVLAAAVRILDRTLVRVGNDEYARENGSYGLTTLRDKHVEFRKGGFRLAFSGKGGKRVEVEVDDPRLAEVVKRCRDVPGYELFQYYDAEGEKRRIESGDVNDYLREITGEEFTAKDFRTWAGTLFAAAELLECEPCESERTAKRNVTGAVEKVAERLGNTPAVCRSCYIHPVVIDRYVDGTLADVLRPSGPVSFEKVRGLSEEESAVLALIEEALRDEAAA